ncbi:MAG: 16S rRNA (guanine(966)-N(2))-methyltransferase RsmD [Gammaproteobacteria bacterium]|nr:16S rRNA (guanine(966)-N(2))-methyltransferase RsmD [Gammaproteobacteria bacterium]
MKKRKTNQLRIIGGLLRGSKIDFPDEVGLRPTTDRIRETLFNWVMNRIEGSRSLDLYAGSGSLGIEALSRGASEVVFIEENKNTARFLADNIARLNITGSKIISTTALSYLKSVTPNPFDLVFIDPPYALKEQQQVLEILVSHQWVHQQSRIYVEMLKDEDIQLPDSWCWLKRKVAGGVSFGIVAQQE